MLAPPDSQPYSSDIYDPFWAAAQELKMPVSLHAITGMGMESRTIGASATCGPPCCRTRSRSRSAC